MPRSRALLRWKIWNRSKLARRRHWARFRRSRRGRSMFPGYRPIPRPVPRYRTLTPRVQSYRRPAMPGPRFAPIRPLVAPYAPAPMPRMPGYRPVGRPGYTYTTAQRQQAARAAYANKANQVAEAASDRSMEAADEAETEEQGSSGTMKIAIALALVGGTVWLVKKNKKSGAKKKGATAAKKTTSTSSFA